MESTSALKKEVCDWLSDVFVSDPNDELPALELLPKPPPWEAPNPAAEVDAWPKPVPGGWLNPAVGWPADDCESKPLNWRLADCPNMFSLWSLVCGLEELGLMTK